MTSAVKMERSVFLWHGDVIRMMTVVICQMRLVVTQVSLVNLKIMTLEVK